MTTFARLAALSLLAASATPRLFSADSPVVIERAPDADESAAQAEAASLRRENEQLKTSLAAATAAKNLSEGSLQDATRELATLRVKVSQLEKPAADSAAQLAAEKKRADEATTRADSLAPAVEKLSQEKAALEAQLAPSRETDAKLADAQRRLTALQTENDVLKTAAASAPPPALTAKLAETEDKLSTTLRSFSQLQAENDRLKSAAADQSTLAADLEKARQEKAALETQVAAAPSDLGAKLADTQDKLSTTLHSFTQLQAENDRLKSVATDRDTLAAEVEKLRQENASLSARAAATPPPADAGPDLANRLADAESKLSTALRSYSLLQIENDRLKADAATAADSAQAAATKSAGASAAQISALRDELRQTQAQIDALASENAQLKTRLALAGPPPGTTLATPIRPGTARAATAAPAPVTENPSAAPATAPRTHVVVAGDNLARLARQYYGNANRWDEILRANRDVIKNENVLPLGATLQIP